MAVRNIRKQLAGVEDLLLGKGKQDQERSAGVVSITKIDIPAIVETIDELSLVDINKYTTAIVKDINNGGTFIYITSNLAINNGITIFNGWTRQAEIPAIVETIDDLSTVDITKYSVVIVKDIDRGGTFIYDNSKALENNGGTVFNGWVRQYDGAVNVKWFGAKDDGVTDNTNIYTNIINFIEEGSTIEWTNGKYVGNFVSNKSFILNGNSATLIPVTSTNACIRFEGTISEYLPLLSAPSFGDLLLNGFTSGLIDNLVLLYSGNTRASGGGAVNFEILEVKDTGVVYDKVYSDQNGGTPKYAIITPLKAIKINNFNIEASNLNVNGIYIQYAKNVEVTNISMTGGSYTTVYVDKVYNFTIHHISREDVSNYTPGNGYNVEARASKYGKIYSIYSKLVRHSVDLDSAYVIDISKVNTVQNYPYSAIEAAHNGYSGFITIKDCNITTDGYAINFSNDAVIPNDGRLIRNIIIDNINIGNDISLNIDEYYKGIQIDLPTENLVISNISIHNWNSATSFIYPGAYNNQYTAIELYDPRGKTIIDNISVKAATWVVFIANITTETTNMTITNITCERYRNIIAFSNVYGYGDVSIKDLSFINTPVIYGEALINILSTTNTINKLMVYGLKQLPVYGEGNSANRTGKVIKMVNNTVKPPLYSYIDTVGFVGNLDDLSISSGGKIPQYDILRYGEIAQIIPTSSFSLDTTEPFDRPVTTGNKFTIYNRSSTNSITIPNSETVFGPITLAPGFVYEFRVNQNKWKLNRKYSGVTLS